ncbi:MAG TPA: L-threonylcarbamoyladenylate synthase [Acidimicrobiales bacterium]|nr:L-threonylcarbamoyladenylate synthase [Acidimicrobiales bacterium]
MEEPEPEPVPVPERGDVNMRMVRAGDDGALAAAVAALRAGALVVVPTDTVYGLAALPGDAEAVQAVYRAKDRPEGMHLPVLAASPEQVRSLGVSFTEAAQTLARRWWPGPLTLAFGFEAGAGALRPGWLAGRTEVAVRIPDHPFLRALLAETGPLLVTSANPHGAPTPRRAEDVAEALGRLVRLIVDGGALTEVPSTLVSVSGATPLLEREGAIAWADVEAVLAGAVSVTAVGADPVAVAATRVEEQGRGQTRARAK